jgi:hypothetical protein
MFKFWAWLVEPILRAVGAKRLIEIGVDTGANTRFLLEYTSAVGGHLDYIDPAPTFDVNAARARYSDSSDFHRATSIEVLPRLRPAHAVLIDGDHNWYTVHRELELLLERSRETKTPFPLVLFHDVSWPYARRDLYYAPERIPAEHRQPHAKSGMLPGVKELVAGGLNAQLWNALTEGGPKNGVLTAVEDFVAESKVGKLSVVPILFGLGILVPDSLADNGELMKLVEHWQSEAGLRQLVDRVERERVGDMAYVNNEIARLTLERDTATGRFYEANVRADVVGSERNRMLEECVRLRAEDENLRKENDRLRHELDLIHQSHSWRFTSLVRAAGTMLSRKNPWNGK